MKPRTWSLVERLRRRDRRRIWLPLAVVACGISAALILWKIWHVPKVTVTISAGNTEGVWHQFVFNFAREFEGDRLRLRPVVTAGTLDMLERVDRGELDFALVQGGYDLSRYPDVRQVAALSLLPIHLLVKSEWSDKVAADFGELRGKTINLGSGRRTGMYWLSRELLAFAGLKDGSYRASAMTSEQLRTASVREQLPDAIFIATKPPSGMVRRLVIEFGYRLVSLPFGEAFRATAMQPAEPVPADGISIRKEHLPDAEIPAYSYEVSPPVPPRPIPTIGSRVLLITGRSMGSRQVTRALELLLASRYAQTVQPPLTAEIVRQPAEAPWHPGAIEFRDRDRPLITGELLGIVSNLLQVSLPLGGGILLVWSWLRSRVLSDRERRIDRFIALVSGVEHRALDLGQAGVADHQALRRLHRELSTIKDAALERIAAGEAGNPLLVSTLFDHISDVRAYLADLQDAMDRHRLPQLEPEPGRARAETIDGDPPPPPSCITRPSWPSPGPARGASPGSAQSGRPADGS